MNGPTSPRPNPGSTVLARSLVDSPVTPVGTPAATKKLRSPHEIYIEQIGKLGRQPDDGIRLGMLRTISAGTIMLSSHIPLLHQAVERRIHNLIILMEGDEYVAPGAIAELKQLNNELEVNLKELLSSVGMSECRGYGLNMIVNNLPEPKIPF